MFTYGRKNIWQDMHPVLSNCDKVYHKSASTWLLYFPQVTVLSGKCEKNNH